MDTKNVRNVRSKKKKIHPIVRRNRRYIGIAVFFTFGFFYLLYQVWYLQTVWGLEYEQQIVIQQTATQMNRVAREIMPMRGRILDRNMNPIADSHQVFIVYLDVIELFNRHQRHIDNNTGRDMIQEAAEAIQEVFGTPIDETRRLFNIDGYGRLINRTHYFVLQRNVLPEVAIPLIERIPDIHGDEDSLRWHHDPFFAPQVIGFIRGDNSWGLESFYHSYLEGDPGRAFWVQGTVEEIPVRDGHTLVTTLDTDIQRLAQSYVNQAFIDHPSQFVGMIVMDPFTGAILAMAQAPTFSAADPFNPDYITDLSIQNEWLSLNAQDQATVMNRMWRNYHTTRSSEPGSVFKPFVMAAAIEEGVITEHTTFYCAGRRQIADRTVTCWNLHGHGAMTFRQALYESCNIAMIDINRLLGRDLFYQYRGYFGFGEFTGIDLPGETDVSSPIVMYPFHRLGLVEMATSSIGQGFNTTTIQMITGYAALINGGNMIEPFVVSQIVDASGNVIMHRSEPTITRRVISQQTSDFIRREMQYVMTADRGTGRRLQVPGHAIGGKTGTAQQGPRDDGRNNHTMVVYTPVENPQYLILMVIDSHVNRDIQSGLSLGPILSDFISDLVNVRNIQPSDGPDAVQVWQAAQATSPIMPDLSGRRLADVIRDINNVNTGGFVIIGEGINVDFTIPAAGQPMPITSAVFIYMDADSIIPESMTRVPNLVGQTADRAEFLLQEAGLPAPMVHQGERPQGIGIEGPFTARAEIIDPNTITAPQPRTVYAQFPPSNTLIERGTQIMIRVR